MSEDKIDSIQKRTEEIQDIIEQMPHHTGRMAAIIVAALAALLLLFGWIIEYPEMAQGPITISAQIAPVKLVSKAAGKLILLNYKSNDYVKEGDVIALIESPADLQDILTVDSIMKDFAPEMPLSKEFLNRLPRDINLGELTDTYFRFLNALELTLQYRTCNTYKYQKEENILQTKAQYDALRHLDSLKSLKAKSNRIVSGFLRKDSLQYYQLKDIAEIDLDKSKMQYYNSQENFLSIQKDIKDTRNQVTELRIKHDQLGIDQSSYEQKLGIDLVTSCGVLKNGIRQWLMSYTFTAPFSGKLEFLDFWKQNDFVEAGKELFSILPDKNHLLGNVYLPITGAGKIAAGQNVNIKLENYPYMEYGVVEGKVKSVSTLAGKAINTQEKGTAYAYLVTIDLPNNLTTNYGTNLGFQYEIKGVAEIITNKRRLIERLFDNLKYIASVK